MTNSEPRHAMEEATPATPDVVVALGEGCKDVEAIEGEKDVGVSCGEGEKVDKSAGSRGIDEVADEVVGIAEDPNQLDVVKVKNPGLDAVVDVQPNDITAAVDVLRKVGAPVASSTLVDDPTEAGMQTNEFTNAADDLTEVDAALVSSTSTDDPTDVCASLLDDVSNKVSTRGVHCLDDQTDQEVGGDSLDAEEAAPLANDVKDDIARMDKDVAVSDDAVHAHDQESSKMDAATTLSNDVETELAAAGDHFVEKGTDMDMQTQSGDGNEVGSVGNVADTAMDEGKHMGAVTTTSDDSEKHNGLVGVDASDGRMQMDRGGLTEDANEQKELATPVEDSVEDDAMQIGAVNIAGDMDKEGRLAIEKIADETLDEMIGTDAPEGKALQMDEAGDDIPEEEGVQMGGFGLTGDDNELKEAVTADHDGVEGNIVPMDAAATTNDDDDDEGILGEDGAQETVSGMFGDDVPEEASAHMDDDDDDDEPPPLMAKKGGGRRKKGRPSSKAQAAVKLSIKRKDEEEVCFICFDGGDLVICDRRGCPKAYHPSCVNRDDDFFKSKGRWNCGWHICSNCQKPARHMCYTCTYSLCKACMKDAKFSCVRGNKGFCDTCMNTVMLIENREEATDQMDVDFDDKSSWWYLFKDYWINLKTNLSLTVQEISSAKLQKSGELPDTNDEEANSESSSGRHLENNTPKKRGRKRLKQAAIEDGSEGKENTRKSTKRGLSGIHDTQTSSGQKVRKLSRRSLSRQHSSKESESVGTSTSSAEEASWASKELINFVAHMRNGDKSVISQFDVQPLILEYVKRNNLRNPRRKSQIICDSLLQSLFAKERVGHFEMLKLLESHFPTSEVSPIDVDENHGGVVDPDPSHDADGNSEASVVMSSEKRRKSRKYDHRRQPNLDDYAAIDNHNIGLMYLRRNLMEELMGDVDTFDEKVVGSFVRIRIPGTGQRQDIYRLVQVVGTGRAAEKYKSGKKTTDITLEILNLDKREAVTIDIISNQEFTEEECKRLRQSIKYGFIPRLTVGEVQEKARVLQTLKVNDWIESEKMRLGHLRDRASDMGHRKELRECVEKLKLLSTPEERARRLNDEPEIHADPAMDPDYESPEEQEQETERSSFNKSRGSFLRKDGNLVSPGKGDGRNAAQRDAKTNWEPNRNTWAESTSNMESPLSRRTAFSSHGESAGYTSKSESPISGAQTVKLEGTTRSAPQGPSGLLSGIVAANMGSGAKTTLQSSINESEKVWQYMDPSNKIQGPFSIIQLRKWNGSGYFPPSLKIWKASEKQDDSILLTDALAGKFEKDLPPWEPPHVSSSQIDKNPLPDESTTAGEQTPKSVVPRAFSSSDQRHDYNSTNLGATMIHSGTQGYYGMQNSHAAYTAQQSLTGSWNATSSQFGAAANPMTPTQLAMGSFFGQSIMPVGNMSHLAPGMAPASAHAEMANSDLSSQNQIPPALPQSESKAGDDDSHGRVSSSTEAVEQLDAQRGPAQLNTQQLADTTNKISSTDVSSSMMPSQMMSASSAASVQPSMPAIAGSDNQSSGWAVPAQAANTAGQSQVAGNLTWQTATQGDASMGWGIVGQNNMNIPWAASAQGASGYNMGVAMPTQPNAVPSMGWLPNPGSTSMNMVWAATQGQGTPNAAAMMGGQMQGVTMSPWGGGVASGNANSYPGWATQQIGNMNQNVGWSAPVQGNPGQANNNMNWNAPNNDNPDWNKQQRDNGGRHSGHRGPFSAGDSGGRSWKRSGICYSYRDFGRCRNVVCPYDHPRNMDAYWNDQHFNRQNPGNGRRYDTHNEGNARQFDTQHSDNDRFDDRHNGRDDDRHNVRQTDRSQSREPR